MKIITKYKLKPLVVALLTAALLGGCVSQKFSEKQEEALVQACLPAINEFLAERYGEYELGEFHMEKSLIEPENSIAGHFGSNVVRGSYTTDGNTWDLAYDSETGAFYTGELMDKLKKQEAARMLEYLKAEVPEEDLKDFRLEILDIYYLTRSHNVGIDGKTTADTYVYIENVLPAELKEEELPGFAARDFDGGIVSWMVCHYYSDRADALTDEAFEKFFADNRAYRVGKYLGIKNDNPSAKEEIAPGSEENGHEEPEDFDGTLFLPEPAGKDADCSIAFDNGIVFAKRPYFTESGGIVTMEFNGIAWYRVRVIQREDAKEYFPDEKMLACSGNLKVFPSYSNQEFEYSCVFSPDDISAYVFLFETNSSPDAPGFGFGFTDCIHYYAGGEEIFPDTELKPDPSGNN